jgi:hypothetical protein
MLTADMVCVVEIPHRENQKSQDLDKALACSPRYVRELEFVSV